MNSIIRRTLPKLVSKDVIKKIYKEENRHDNTGIPFDFENCALKNNDLEKKLPTPHTANFNITGLHQINTEPMPENWAQRNIQYIGTKKVR